MAFNTLGLSLTEVSGNRADIYLSDLSEKAGFLWVKWKDRKCSILALPILKVRLIPVPLASTLKTEMRNIGGAKRRQSILWIWRQWGNIQHWGTNPWEIFRVFLRNTIFFPASRGIDTTNQRTELFHNPREALSEGRALPLSWRAGQRTEPCAQQPADCRKHDSGYKDWNV